MNNVLLGVIAVLMLAITGLGATEVKMHMRELSRDKDTIEGPVQENPNGSSVSGELVSVNPGANKDTFLKALAAVERRVAKAKPATTLAGFEIGILK